MEERTDAVCEPSQCLLYQYYPIWYDDTDEAFLDKHICYLVR